jgi:colicin import membrane protein
MPDTVFSAKIDENVKARFEAGAQAAGTSQKEFFGRLVAFYETAQSRESLPQVKEIEQLRHHLARIEEIFVGLVKSSQDRQEADAGRIMASEDEAVRAKATVAELTERLASVIEQSGTEVDAVRSEAARVKEAAAREVQDARDSVARARESQQQSAKLAALAEEAAASAKARADDLEGLAGQAERYKQESEQARKELQVMATRLDDADAALKAQAAKADDDLQRAVERADVEKERAVLAAQRESITEIGALREALARTREENAELKVQMAQRPKPDRRDKRPAASK